MDFENWEADRLAAYVRFLLHHYRVVDAFWFLNVESEFGHEKACDFNEAVWSKATELAMPDLKAKLGLKKTGLEGFVEALRLWPWTILVGYEIQAGEAEVVVSVPSCPPQEARLKRGLGEYDCRGMHEAEFIKFATGVDPGIRVECEFAPPAEHPPDCFCRWRFTMAPD